jgi:transcriptional regulator of arginine metabolism
MHKSERHKAILNIISTAGVRRQDELADILSRNGFEVTQASVSRDLDELGVIKVHGKYALPRPNSLKSPFGMVSVETAGDSLVVAKCSSGLASAAAVRIDGAAIPDIVGTIAGDDTIFIAVRDGKRQSSVVRALYELFRTDDGE